MKKIQYITPSMKVVDIDNETILAGSNFNVEGDENSYTGNDFGSRPSHMIFQQSRDIDNDYED